MSADSGAQLARHARQLIRNKRYREAFQVAAKARDKDPLCSQAYVAEGMALFGLGKYEESLAALAEGLSACPNDYQLLKTIIEVALKSEFKHDLRENLGRLEESNLANNAFLVCSFIGQDLHRISLHQAAIDVLESALVIGTDSVKLKGSVLTCLSTAYWSVGDRDEAIRCMNEELVLYRENNDIIGEIQALAKLAKASQECGNLTEAVSCLKDQIRASRDYPEQQSQAATMLSQITCLERTLTLLEKLDAHSQCYLDLSKRLTEGQKQKSLEKTIQIAISKKDELILVQSLIEVGQYYNKAKNYPNAIKSIENAIQIMSRSKKILSGTERDTCFLQASASLAHCYRASGNHKKCVEVSKRGAELARKVNNPDIEFHCLGEAGRSYQILAKWDDALKAFELQRELLSELSLPVAWADCLLGIVDCHEKLDRFSDGLETLMELVAKCESDFSLRLRIFDRMFKFQEINLFDVKGAIRSVELLLFAAIKTKNVESERDAYYHLGRLHQKVMKYEQAERCLEKALQIDRSNQKLCPELEIEVAKVALHLKNYQKARTVLANRHEIESIYILAQIEEESGQVTVAIDLYKSILSLKTPKSDIREGAMNRLAKCFQKINQHDQAVETLREAVKDIRDSDSKSDILNRTGISHSSEGSNPEQLHLSLAESLAAIEHIEEAYAEAKQAGPTGSSLRELLLVRMGKLQEALLERTSTLQPGLHFSLCRLDLHCWMVNEYNHVAAFCGQSGAAKQLGKLVQCIRNELAPKLETSNLSDEDDGIEMIELSEASEYLYDALISPFESELVPEQAVHIYCHSPIIMSIPWSLLTSTTSPIPLFERFRLSVLPGDINIAKSEPCKKNIFSRIQTWDTKDDGSTENAVFISNEVELECECKDANLVWLSLKTHEQTGCVQLADHRCEPDQMFRTNLDLSHIDLVVLDQPGTRDIAHVLLRRGVKNVFYPLWHLPKTAIRDLIALLEDKLESMHPIKAIQEIQFKQKNGKRFKDPCFWSAWIPIGIEYNEPETMSQCLYNLLRFDPDRARMTLLKVENGDMPFSKNEKLNEIFIEEFSNLVPSLLTLPVETLSSMVNLLMKPKILHQIKKEIEKKGNFEIDLTYWSTPGCNEILMSLGLDVVEITNDKVILFGGNQAIIRELYACLSLLLTQSPSSTPDQTIANAIEPIENSPIVSETSSTSPLRHSESSPFRIVQKKHRKLTDYEHLMEIKSIPESPKKVEIMSGRLSLPPMQHQFRSLWLEHEEKLEKSDDRSSGFGSGPNKEAT